MLNNISWSSYWTALTILTTFYYVIVVLIFYHCNVRKLLNGKIDLLQSRKNHATRSLIEDQFQHVNDENELRSMVACLRDEVIAYLDQKSYTQYEKPEVIYALHRITRKFEALKGSKHQATFNQLIQSVCGEKCGIHLNDSELEAVWRW